MLVELRVTDLGIIEELNLVLGPGLTAITGETGAGKTLVVEALELLAGQRADTTLVRPGAAEARVEGRFVEPESDEETVLVRVVPAEGRSRAYIDGRLATAGELASLAARLIDLHGQHAHQMLLTPAAQRAALDAFAGEPAATAAAEYRDVRRQLRSIEESLAGLGGDTKARAREIALLEFQVTEIDAAGIDDPNEETRLDAEESALGDAIAHREALGVAYASVDGSAQDGIGRAVDALTDRAPFADLQGRLRGAQSEIAELAQELRAAQEAVVDDPERLDAVRARRRSLRDLQRKYGDTLEEVQEYHATSAARLEELRGYEASVALLEADRDRVTRALDVAAKQLRAARLAAAAEFSEAVGERIGRLAMSGARFEVEVAPAEPTEAGADRITILLGANPGEPALPLTKVASGGELSRAMLALRVVLMERSGPPPGPGSPPGPALVFDEVDAGIGGEAGAAVGRELAGLAAKTQVLCITHLAQVAACATDQVVVRKSEQAGRTVALASPVAGEDRIAELSRMLAGAGGSDHARRHAEELLTQRGSR